MLSNKIKMGILIEVIRVQEKATCFSAIEFMKGEGLDDHEITSFYDDNLYSGKFSLAMNIIETFEENSDQSSREYLLGESFAEEEVDLILSTKYIVEKQGS